MKPNITPTNTQIKLKDQDFIISKTDISGRLTYVNRIFMDIANYPESDLLGVQHNVIRHPDMPRGVFQFLWKTLKAGDEFLGFVKNLCLNGEYYWVFANITLDHDKEGKLQGYYSVRRKPPQSAIDIIIPLYKEMLAIESRSSTKEAPDKSLAYLMEAIAQTGAKNYNHFILNLYKPNGRKEQ